jgi:methionyl-tRNA synthetase
LSRTLTMVEKYFAGAVPDGTNIKITNAKAEEIKTKATLAAREMENAMPEFDFTRALEHIWEVIGLANKFIEDAKPWTLAKENRTDELALVIYTLLEALRIITIEIASFMPETSRKIWAQLGMVDSIDAVKFSDAKVWGKFRAGAKVNKSGPLFPRIEINK